MKIEIKVFWVVALCSDALGYQIFGGLWPPCSGWIWRQHETSKRTWP